MRGFRKHLWLAGHAPCQYDPVVSPTVFREGPYRFYFFSREETRVHVHVASGEGEAKYWLNPKIELAENHGLPQRELKKLDIIIRDHEQEIRDAWKRHFGG